MVHIQYRGGVARLYIYLLFTIFQKSEKEDSVPLHSVGSSGRLPVA